MELYSLRQAGYPFAADDLALTTWMDLGILTAVIQSKRGIL